MDKIRIAILDTGINTNLLKEYVFGGVSLIEKADDELLSGHVFEDDNGHGTGCAYAILRLVDNVDFYVIKVLNSRLKTSSATLITALEHLIYTDVDIINMSMATSIYNRKMEMLCDELANQGKIIVASRNNLNHRSFPAEFASVLGVSGSNLGNMNYYWFNDKYTIQCVADSTPIWIPSINNPPYYMPVSSNSKAAPVFAGIVAGMLLNGAASDTIKSSLIHGAHRSSWSEHDINTSNSDAYSFIKPDMNVSVKSFKIVKEAIRRHTAFSNNEIDAFIEKPFINSGITVQQYGMILYDIEQMYGKEFRLKNVDAPHVNSIYALAQLLDE